MQTFMPSSSFRVTAKCLDKKRLFKQVVESRQLLASLGVKVRKNDGTYFGGGWKNHPASKMWKGYEFALMAYHDAILTECKRRGINTQIQAFNESYPENLRKPPFVGNKKFHDSHKSNLLRKDKEYYSKFGWNVPDNLPYVWGSL